MNKKLTEIIFLLDRSGSMSVMGDEPYQGYNKFIQQQNDPSLGEANVTLVLFDSLVETLYTGVPISEVIPLTNKEYQSGGMTSLRDAIGSTFTETGKRLAAIPEKDRPGKVIVCILTDGEDTSSKEYSTEQIKTIIQEQTAKYSWNIEFMGTTKESILAAHSYNIMSGNISMFDNSAKGISSAYASSSNRTAAFRSS